MEVQFDPEADAAYIQLAEGTGQRRSHEVGPGVIGGASASLLCVSLLPGSWSLLLRRVTWVPRAQAGTTPPPPRTPLAVPRPTPGGATRSPNRGATPPPKRPIEQPHICPPLTT